MKFSDIVELAKAGYKPSDVKELLELCETDPATKNLNTATIPAVNNPPTEPEPDAFEKLIQENK